MYQHLFNIGPTSSAELRRYLIDILQPVYRALYPKASSRLVQTLAVQAADYAMQHERSKP
jgi:hypothetical protein